MLYLFNSMGLKVDQIQVLVAKHAQARADHDWAHVDELLALGVEVEDPDGESRWRMRA